MVELGVSAYRASLAKFNEAGQLKAKTLGSTEPGMVIATELIGPLVEAIKDEQDAALDRLYSNKGGVQLTMDPIWLAAEAEVLGACTVLIIMNTVSSMKGEEYTWATVCRTIGAAVCDQISLDQWRQRENEAQLRRKAEGLEPYPNLVRLMEKRNAVVDKRVLDKWSKKAALFSDMNWSQALKMTVGHNLGSLLVKSNAWFEVVQVRLGPANTVNYLKLTELGAAWIDSRHERNELNCPNKLPMICEPADFHYPEEPPQDESDSETQPDQDCAPCCERAAPLDAEAGLSGPDSP